MAQLNHDRLSLLAADPLGIRLEVVNGLSIWEAQPLYKHQKAVEHKISVVVIVPHRGCAVTA